MEVFLGESLNEAHVGKRLKNMFKHGGQEAT